MTFPLGRVVWDVSVFFFDALGFLGGFVGAAALLGSGGAMSEDSMGCCFGGFADFALAAFFVLFLVMSVFASREVAFSDFESVTASVVGASVSPMLGALPVSSSAGRCDFQISAALVNVVGASSGTGAA